MGSTIDFPNTPTEGQVYSYQGLDYSYTDGAWTPNIEDGTDVITVVPAPVTNELEIDLSQGRYFTADNLEEIISADPISVVWSGSTNVEDVNLVIPATQADDVIILLASFDNGLNMNANGFITIVDAAGAVDMFVAYKVRGDGTDTVQIKDNYSVALVMVLRGVKVSDLIDVQADDVGYGIDSSYEAPSVTTNYDGSLVLTMFAVDDDQIESLVTAPSGYSDMVVQESVGAGTTAAIAVKNIPVAGVESPPSFGGTSTDSWLTFTFAIRRNTTSPTLKIINPKVGVVNSGCIHAKGDFGRFEAPSSIILDAGNILFTEDNDLLLSYFTDDDGTTTYIKALSAKPSIGVQSPIELTSIDTELDWSAGDVFILYYSYTAGLTLTFSNMKDGQTVTLYVYTGGTLSFPSACKLVSGTYIINKYNKIELHCVSADTGLVFRTIA